MSDKERRGGTATVSGASGAGLRHYVEEIVASGFPGIRPLAGRARQAQLGAYLAST